MKKLREQLYCPVFDVMKMPEMLNRLAEDQRKIGYEVERGVLGTVILKLGNGEVHFVPDGNAIIENVFKYEIEEVGLA